MGDSMNKEKNQVAGKKSLVQQTFRLLARFGFDGFILALIAMIALAWLWPQGGTGEGAFSLSNLASYGVSLIFFFYGLRLSRQKLKAGLSNWKLHLVVHLSTFLLFPLLILALRPLASAEDTRLLWLGSFFLASLPSTVSSSVVMVSIAEGNIPAAIFNASISSLLGVFITPLWMQVVMTAHAEGADFSSVLGKLLLQVLVPVILGLLLHGAGGGFAEKHRKALKYFDQSVILVIVYTAFSKSFAQNMFSSLGVLELLLLATGIMLLFFVVYFLVTGLCRFLKFNREDRITAVFCGSKKSLVHGTVMSKVLFGNSTLVGILLLPLMIYHALQLIIVSMLAQRMAKNKKKVENVTDPGGAVAI